MPSAAHRLAEHLRGRLPDRSTSVQRGTGALKAGVAATAAWVVAEALVPQGTGFYGPLVAVLSVHPTLLKTVSDAVQRLVAIALGLGIGYLAVVVGGVTWWTLGAALVTATVLSSWHRLGEEGVQVPVGALLVLLFASEPLSYAGQLLVEGVIGAVAAAAVNVLVLPPLHVEGADRALVAVRTALGDTIDAMSRDVGGDPWPPEGDPDWLRRAREVDRPLRRAVTAVEQGSESVLLNPRGRRLRGVPPHQREVLIAMEHVTVTVRDIAGTLEQTADPDDPSFGLDEEFRPELAEALHLLAGAITAYGDPESSGDAAGEQRPVERAAEKVRALQQWLTECEVPGVSALLAEGALVTGLDLAVRELQRAPLHQGRPSTTRR